MDIKKQIEQISTTRIRSVAKNEAIYDNADEARKAETAASSAKNPKDFEKSKKKCLGHVEDGETAIKPWEKELEDWEANIKKLESEIAAEKEKIAQKQKEVDAVNKAIDEINVDIKKYNDSLLLGERDPRARPLVARKDVGPQMTAANNAVKEAEALVNAERKTLKDQKEWVGKPIKELKEINGRMAKAKYKGK
jgi:chromosome segregation ATPase